jgi:toxin ParE1/3/4
VRVVFSPAAECDLEEIGDYIAADNPHRAISFIREIREHCHLIASAPKAAPLWPELGDNVRMAPHGRYLILYTLDDDFLRIERVVHGARDLRGSS